MPKIPPFVGEFSDDDVRWFIAVGENRHVAPGEAVIVEGQHPADIFFVLEGAFRLSSRKYENIPNLLLGPGQLLGELSYVQKKLPLASVIAEKPSTVLCIDRSDLDRKLKVDQGFEIRFTRVVNEFVTKRLYEIWTDNDEPESDSEPEPPRDDADRRVYELIKIMLNNEFSGELPGEEEAEKDRGKGKDRKTKEEKGKGKGPRKRKDPEKKKDPGEEGEER